MGTKEDREFAKAVNAGERSACARFIEEYSNRILSHVVELMNGGHCRQPARTTICSLLIVQRQRKGITHYPEDQCDECMDSYLWFIETLTNKVGAYKGKNNCSLNTFVFSILKSHSTYIDWIRWKYKRCDRPPKCIARLDKIYHKVFEYLCERKTEEIIANMLALAAEEARKVIHRVKTELIRSGQIDLVESFYHVSIHSDDPEEQDLPLSSGDPGVDELSIERQHTSQINEIINELPPHQARLIRHKFLEEMSAEAILGFYKKLGFSPVPGKDIFKLKVQDIYYEIKKAIEYIRKRIKEKI